VLKTARGCSVSEKGLEAPEADLAEQETDAIPDDDDDDDSAMPEELPLEADEADAADQARRVSLDDDDYR
jgi:hypothetical protein